MNDIINGVFCGLNGEAGWLARRFVGSRAMFLGRRGRGRPVLGARHATGLMALPRRTGAGLIGIQVAMHTHHVDVLRLWSSRSELERYSACSPDRVSSRIAVFWCDGAGTGALPEVANVSTYDLLSATQHPRCRTCLQLAGSRAPFEGNRGRGCLSWRPPLRAVRRCDRVPLSPI